MPLNTLEEIATFIVADGKGILAADESNPTCGKRFDSIGVESSELNRRDYREMLFRANGMKGNIGGVILFDETIRQTAEDGTSLVQVIMGQGALPGIKVDQGLQPLSDSPDETLTQGLDGLNERCAEYFQLGAKFTKWRAVIKIDGELPSAACIESNMQALADYAKIVQDNNMVPMVEPEVLMDGNHSIERCYEVSSAALKALFASLAKNDVNIQGTILKPNMVTAGSLCESQASVQEVAEMTVRCLQENVPADLPGITFLSGGQSEINATAHLDAMNKIGGFPWKLSFSYGRALQQAALKTWLGKSENILDAQAVFSHRALMNKLAAEGAWSSDKELN
ncbi:MAG: fructose-bisphosphate aldolase [SAR86 cluster bacterium BACL1 MAG-120924-bin88]|jgi:fructose-bisphosphate aldolase, class I|uniref:Probable fructose-bisphosphate aldolase class 1 n=1 Tax=SAR86 cluster bacterium BACL1 MAG-120820-bin45 TaxID=1655612 RepID=A0A0R2U6X6_9GAMM|nr:MAG: fructose-bisphosphate aldolase [SAR86 cluster bacterium BACL1 MAG-120820-bin45]KRP00440.1 MAG: fructose-bisphosphate aldolase [SAR86 cluster bacterium BACL1 MAG-120813-bin36]KRP02439.1 MAG: fructose-bisphosphate aldolase [SAR86 cluster bacterium BACL1 MAG-120619-bin26]KRP03277.1 MAG: fructose-bisphosphate aldolase [SAR86 cluster bacterium BACL1 MAG-120924-bin88]KRP08780.1 MAG: fructose-bisphosphate aldolase [SAR86 cluster bacterium BACL1 MAG-121004-bin11]KRP17507.1 MAG: fructose-bispho|tara:strand:- start:2090 stop:3106 length:1017 start_codon:yes stop_codon:yes gene_type:complete